MENNDVPFHIKRKVFQAALMSSILYRYESWLNDNIKPIHKFYMWYIKQILGMKKNTCNDLRLIELGLPSVCALIKPKQIKIFFSRMWSKRKNMTNDPWAHAIRVILDCNFPTAHYIRDQINNKKLAINGIK